MDMYYMMEPYNLTKQQIHGEEIVVRSNKYRNRFTDIIQRKIPHLTIFPPDVGDSDLLINLSSSYFIDEKRGETYKKIGHWKKLF